jgi:hypothetical protein
VEGWEYCRPRFFFEWPRRQLPKYRSPQPSVHNGPANCVVRRRRQTGATATAVLARAALCSGLRRRAQSDRSIRRGQQQQEECPVSFVIGSGSAVFAALHDHVPFGCTDAPVPFSAAPLQDRFKDWKSTIRHLKGWKLTIRHDLQPMALAEPLALFRGHHGRPLLDYGLARGPATPTGFR